MTEKEPGVTCQQLLDNLNKDWESYPDRFRKMDPARQAIFLQEQGYANFHDLLAHIVAWWEEAIKIVDAIMDLEELPTRQYDLDAFNADAIKNYQNWKDTDLLFHYENLRQALIDLVVDLPENGLENQRINNWLNACLVEHFHTHDIS
jgi:hypothetical protein